MANKPSSLGLILIPGLCLFLSGCLTSRSTTISKITPALLPLPTPIPREFRIVGYAADWNADINGIQFDKLTHLNYAFLLPNADGTITEVGNPDYFHLIIRRAHANKVKVLISVGGWGYDEQFERLAANAETRHAFIEGLAGYVATNDLDGVDIDWEYPDPGASSHNYLLLMQGLRQALPVHILLTSAVVAAGSLAEGIPVEIFPVVDFLNIMAYDAAANDHSPYSYAKEALDYWESRGLPMEKTVLGVPFYGRPGGIKYRDLVANDPAAAYQDQTTYHGERVFYNGIPTLQRKVELALERASGIMIWELSQDTLDDTSLLNAIFQVVQTRIKK